MENSSDSMMPQSNESAVCVGWILTLVIAVTSKSGSAAWRAALWTRMEKLTTDNLHQSCIQVCKEITEEQLHATGCRLTPAADLASATSIVQDA